MDPKLEALIRAASDLTTTAFVDQKLVVKTPLHTPMQKLMDALADYPPYWDVLKKTNDEDRAGGLAKASPNTGGESDPSETPR